MKFNILKVFAIAFGFFTLFWMSYDFFSNRKSINQNYLEANEAFLNKEYKKAFKYYNLALLKEPKNIFILEGKARALFRMGNFTEAENLFKLVLEQDKNFVPALANLGILYDTLGDYKNAIKFYKLAVNKESKITDGMTWYKRFLKNIHFKPSSVKQRLEFLQIKINSNEKKELRNIDIDKKQPDFEM